MKELFKNKPIGFYILLGSIGLTFITAITYLLCYLGHENLNIFSIIILSVSVVMSSVLFFIKKIKVIPYVLWFLNFVAFLFFIYGVYRYVVDVFVGIDYDHFEFSFIITALLFLLSVGTSTSTIFLKLTKEGEK